MFKLIDMVEMFCYVDDFCLMFEPQWRAQLVGKNLAKCEMTTSEVLTILILFQFSTSRNFKYFYKQLQSHHQKDFPKLLSYNRFVEIEKNYLVPLICFMKYHFSNCTGISYIDATPIKVCNNKRISQNKVFKGLATIGKSTMGWFYGFKLHLVANERGEPIDVALTKGNRDDRRMVKQLSKKIQGKLFGDKGYISQSLFEEMLELGVKIVTQLKKTMRPKLMENNESLLLKKRSVIESIFHIMKDMLHIDHTRHRSPMNFLINFFGAIAAYCLYPNKPKIKMPENAAGKKLIISSEIAPN